jgi:5,5'-dehydrodivanillate O-demethylase
MLTQEENELLTQVGPGTPGGELLRRYWHPVAAAGELTAERPRKRLKILGEELVLYRTESGSYGLLAEHCSHRGTSLSYGFVEGECLRCPYHGWLYDAQGRCVEQPFEPAQSLLKHTLRHPAYPVQELGGLLFAYLGPPEKQPLLPRWDLLVWPGAKRRIVVQPILACNWLQAEENSADVTHTFFLHGHTMKMKGLQRGAYLFSQPFARYGFQPFPWGLLKSWEYEGQLGTAGWGNLLVFPTMLRQHTAPGFAGDPDQLDATMHWRTPVDDTHTQIFQLRVEWRPRESVEPAPEPEVSYARTWFNEDGEYHMETFESQDGMAWETQGTIMDRRKEHLGASDRGIVMFRDLLREQIETVQRGGDPICTVRDPDENALIDLEVWLSERGSSALAAKSSVVERMPREAVLDARHEVFEVPFGAARPRAAGN